MLGQKCAKVLCTKCKQECQGLVKRMKAHHAKCHPDSVVIEDIAIDNDDSSTEVEIFSNKPVESIAITKTKRNTSCLSTIDKFVVKTTKQDKEAIDLQCGRFIFATNSPFRLANNAEFQKFRNMLRPGYKPPDQHEELQNEIVCLSIDGWENISNEPILCACVTKDNGTVFLVDTLNTNGMQHTAGNLIILATRVIQESTEKFNCYIKSFVTDNAPNMVNMRQNIEVNLDGDIISYGCSAHALNLLAKDMAKVLNFNNC